MFAKPVRQFTYSARPLQPGAVINLARVLRARHPSLSVDRSIENASQIIRALNSLQYDIGPSSAWGTDTRSAVGRSSQLFDDALNLLADQESIGRKPYIPDGEY